MKEPALEALTTALTDPTPEAMDTLRSRLRADVQVFAPFGVGKGVEAVESLITHPTVRRLAPHLTWSAPAPGDGGLLTLTGVSPPQSPVGGLRVGVRLDDDGRIGRIEQDLLPAAPQEAAPLALTDEHKRLLDESLSNGTPVLVVYVDDGGRPRLSYRATVQVLGPDRIGMWIRDPNGGLLRALPAEVRVSAWQRGPRAAT